MIGQERVGERPADVLAVVVPCYEEVAVLEETTRRLGTLLK